MHPAGHIRGMPEREVVVEKVDAHETRSGNKRYVLVDSDGNEYTTFKENIARDAVAAEGQRARIEFHERERNGFTNVYLDSVTPVEDADPEPEPGDASADEVAWNTAVETAPWLLGSSEPEGAVEPKALYGRLKPFKDLVAEDIERGGDDG
jgi:hypothetical protein